MLNIISLNKKAGKKIYKKLEKVEDQIKFNPAYIVKETLKKFLPTPFLKACFLLYNKVKICTIDKLLYSSYILSSIENKHKLHRRPFELISVEKGHMLPKIAKEFEIWDDWFQDEYLVVINKPITIEPKHGWGIRFPNRLVYESLGFSRVSYLPKPQLINYWWTKKDHYHKVISLRDTGELNYFHFYNDVIAKLFYLEDYGILDNSIPIVVSKKLFEREYFQFFIKRLGYEELNWIIQGKQYIKADETVFSKPLTHTKAYYDRFRCIVDTNFSKKNDKRIFLTRNSNKLRYAENMEDIAKVCIKYGFEIIDTELMTIEAQIALFANTRYLVSLHGAGEMNLLFCQQPTAVLSIFRPGPYLAFHYILLANMYNFYFDALVGEKSRKFYSGGFIVNPMLLEERIIELLKN